MLTTEIIQLIRCTVCNAMVGVRCQDSQGNEFADSVHDKRRQDAIMQRNVIAEVDSRRASEAPQPSYISRGRDCAWCGVEGTSKPVTRYGVTWDLCQICVGDMLCAESMATEGARQQRARASSARALASPYPEQEFKLIKPGKPLVDVFAEEKRKEPARVIDPWASWNAYRRPLQDSEKAVPCPECAAPIGKPCLDLRIGSLKGRVTITPHVGRVMKWNEERADRARIVATYKKDAPPPYDYDALQQSLSDSLSDSLLANTYTPIQNAMREAEEREKKRRREANWRLNPAWVEEERRRADAERGRKEPVPTEKAEGTTLELKPLVGIWRPRLIEEYLVEGMDWPWSCGSGAGEIRVYYTLAERKLWVATIGLDKDSPGGLSREFWKRGRGAFVAQVDTDRVLQPVEVSADHRNGGQRLRWFGVLQSLDTVAGIAEFVHTAGAVEAIDLAERLKNPQLQLKKTDRRFNFE